MVSVSHVVLLSPAVSGNRATVAELDEFVIKPMLCLRIACEQERGSNSVRGRKQKQQLRLQESGLEVMISKKARPFHDPS
jgi:hypothetical protein